MSRHRSRADTLFEQSDQLVEGWAAYSESQYAYLCRSARPEAAGVRDLMESWLAQYPRVHRGEMIARLRTRDDEHFFAAFFELYVFMLLRQLGHYVRVHPRAGRRMSKRRPDFAAVAADGNSAIVETVLAYEESATQRPPSVVLLRRTMRWIV